MTQRTPLEKFGSRTHRDRRTATVHQPGDGLAFEIAGLRAVMRADIWIAEIVDEIVAERCRDRRITHQIVWIAEMGCVRGAHAVLGLVQNIADRPRLPCAKGLPLE